MTRVSVRWALAPRPRSSIARRLEAGNETIMLILENAPPSAAKRLKVGGMDGRTLAWTIDGHTYVRTPLTLLSPAWDASVSSADGMTVYEIGDAPVLLMSGQRRRCPGSFNAGRRQ